jgi:hypothetical protein
VTKKIFDLLKDRETAVEQLHQVAAAAHGAPVGVDVQPIDSNKFSPFMN